MPTRLTGASRPRAIAWLIVLGILASATHATGHVHGPDLALGQGVVDAGHDVPDSAATLEGGCGLCRSRADERELGVRAAIPAAAPSVLTLEVSRLVTHKSSVRLAQAGPARAPPIA